MERAQVRALFDSDECSIARTVDLIGDRWSMLILREAFYGVGRFGRLQENLGISRAVLADRLERLVNDGLLERVPYQAGGQRPRSEYRLTPAGAELIPAFVALLQWGDRHRNGGRPPVILHHADCGGRVSARLVCEHGHEVPPDALEPRPGPEIMDRAGRTAR